MGLGWVRRRVRGGWWVCGARRVGDGSLAAFRVLGRSQGFGERPVGFPGIQQGADAVVVEVVEPEGAAFDAFGEVVGRYL